MRICSTLLAVLLLTMPPATVAKPPDDGGPAQAGLHQGAVLFPGFPVYGSSCSTPAVTDCGSCAVTCPVGQSAVCKPGRVNNGLCTREPKCQCEGAAPPPAPR